MNPIIQAMQGRLSTSRMTQARQIIGMLKGSGDPSAMISQAMQNNPQVRNIIQQYGGDPKTAFYKYAEANGIDPNELLNMLK